MREHDTADHLDLIHHDESLSGTVTHSVWTMPGLVLTFTGSLRIEHHDGYVYATGPASSPKTGISDSRDGAVFDLVCRHLGLAATVRRDPDCLAGGHSTAGDIIDVEEIPETPARPAPVGG